MFRGVNEVLLGAILFYQRTLNTKHQNSTFAVSSFLVVEYSLLDINCIWNGQKVYTKALCMYVLVITKKSTQP